MLVEQAIYTSAQTAASEGYQLVATSPGLIDTDARALSLWCPSHDSLLADGPAASVNFHRLPTGTFCVSRTARAGQEYSRRGGQRIETHCLIVTPDVLFRFSNDPFALLAAALGGGSRDFSGETPQQLSALRLVGRAGCVNELAIDRLVADHGLKSLAALVDLLLRSNSQLLLTGSASAEPWIRAALACIPLECRTDFSFTTALKRSPRRPFRLGPARKLTRLERDFENASFDLDNAGDIVRKPEAPWTRFIAEQLAQGGASLLTPYFIQPRPGLELSDLNGLAEVLRRQRDEATPVRITNSESEMVVAHSHASHVRMPQKESGTSAPHASSRSKPSHEPQAPEIVEKLEALDDAVYDTIAGRPGALERLKRLWPATHEGLGPDVIEQSREQYLDYALRVWEELRQEESTPEKAIWVLDVLSILLEK